MTTPGVFRAELLAYLRSQRTDTVPHLSGTLYDHLLGTAYLLAQWRNPRHVCVAGMFHSIYGTRDFRAHILQQDSRPVMRELIGAEAESLVHLFSSCNRRSFYGNLAGSGPAIVHGKDDKPVEVSRAVLNSLLEMEVANILDQTQRIDALPARTAAAIRGLSKSLRGCISESAFLALEAFFSGHSFRRPTFAQLAEGVA